VKKNPKKITISPTKLYNIVSKFKPKQNAPPILSHGKGRWAKRLKTKINKGFANTNLLKKTHPSFQIKRMGGQ
jgi:hypothetical protein